MRKQPVKLLVPGACVRCGYSPILHDCTGCLVEGIECDRYVPPEGWRPDPLGLDAALRESVLSSGSKGRGAR